MQERALGQDFEHWVALSDAYAQRISKLRSDGTASLSNELSQIAHDLNEMNSSFEPLVSDSPEDSLERNKKSPADADPSAY